MNVLIVVDIQNDFLPGGALAVPEGDRIIPVVNRLMNRFDLVIATQDWHPPHHGSFASSHPGKNPGEVVDLKGLPQVLWPDHCVQHSTGASFSTSLNTNKFEKIFTKGTEIDIDSYSGFFDNGHRKSTGLAEYLKEMKINRITVVGLATDYCVKFTALDAVTEGFETRVISDATRAVNLRAGDFDNAIREMKEAGVKILTSDKILT